MYYNNSIYYSVQSPVSSEPNYETTKQLRTVVARQAAPNKK